MTARIRHGDRVHATTDIVEENFNGAAMWTHARAGEAGLVREIEGPWATVTWERTGTTYDTRLSDLTRVSQVAGQKAVSDFRS